MVYESIFDQSCFEAIAQYANAHIDIFSETDLGETLRGIKHFSWVSHIETPRVELIQLFIRTSYPSSG